jgi:hypothetical protein
MFANMLIEHRRERTEEEEREWAELIPFRIFGEHFDRHEQEIFEEEQRWRKRAREIYRRDHGPGTPPWEEIDPPWSLVPCTWEEFKQQMCGLNNKVFESWKRPRW